MVQHDPTKLLYLLAEQSLEHAFIFMDAERRIIWWSPGAEKIFGRPASEMLGQEPTSLFTPQDSATGIPRQEFEMALAAGNAEDDRWQLRADGSRFWASGVMMPLRDENGTCIGFGKILRNRTDVKEHVEALRHQVDSLTRTDQLKSEFLATFTHELRNPLAPLSNAVQLLRDSGSENSDTNYAIEVIEKQVEFISRLVDNLLETSRMTTGKLRLNTRVLTIQEIIGNAVAATRSLIDECSHKLQVILPSGPVQLEVDPDRLHQVLVNLITNAAKFTPPHGLIAVKGTTEGEEAVIIVEDNGTGIPPDMLDRIFDLFTQVENPEGRGGLGIGLAVVKDLVSAHGGTVQVRSNGIGTGSEFTVRLPLRASPIGS